MAEEAKGNWFGAMNGHNMSFAHIEKTSKGYQGWFEVHELPATAVDPNAFHVPFDSITATPDRLTFAFTMKQASGTYDGAWDTDKKAWVGAVTWSGGSKGVLSLARTDASTLATAKLPPPKQVNDPVRMDEVVQPYVQNEKFMGAVLVARGNDVLFDKAYGYANMEWQTLATTDTRFMIGSMSKQFAAASILLLEERGKLKTTDLLSKYLPDAPPEWAHITLHNLLTHTSGIPDYMTTPEYAGNGISPVIPDKIYAAVRKKPLDFPIDSKYAYSNTNYTLLALIVQKVGGQTYPQFLQDNILTPLRMNDTAYNAGPTILPHRAAGYVQGPYGLQNEPYGDISWSFGAGGLTSTTHDMFKWEQALLGGKVLSATSLAKMTTPYKKSYGYGVFYRAVNGYGAIEHGGNIRGFNSDMAYYPDDKLTIIVLSNMEGTAAKEILAQLASVSHGEPVVLPKVRKVVTVDRQTLQAYVGTYELEPGLDLVFSLEGDKLMCQPTGQEKAQVFAETDTDFFAKMAEIDIHFIRDPDGKVNAFTFLQNGKEATAKRKV